MKESDFWFIGTIIIVFVALAAVLLRDYLTTDPMFIEMTATFLGVFIAVTLAEGFRNHREEK